MPYTTCDTLYAIRRAMHSAAAAAAAVVAAAVAVVVVVVDVVAVVVVAVAAVVSPDAAVHPDVVAAPARPVGSPAAPLSSLLARRRLSPSPRSRLRLVAVVVSSLPRCAPYLRSLARRRRHRLGGNGDRKPKRGEQQGDCIKNPSLKGSATNFC